MNLAMHISYVGKSLKGSLNAHVSANVIIKFAENKTIDEVWKIQPEDIIKYLKTLPEHEHHCAELLAGTFYLALKTLK